jgi:hypothetical protein
MTNIWWKKTANARRKKMAKDRNNVGSKMPNEIEIERIDLSQVVK